MKDNAIIVFCTVPSTEIADIIASKLVENKLAACCNILPGMKSVYRWKEKIESSKEVLLLIKSTENNFKRLESEVRILHPYEVPEIISVTVQNGLPEYVEWIKQNTIR
ncbi:MAG: divalent-cation tolerance protein CutA [Calditrichaceae bacterium]